MTPSLLFILILPLLGALVNGLLAILTATGRIKIQKTLTTVFGLASASGAFVLAARLFVKTLTDHNALPFSLTPLFSWMAAGTLSIDFGLQADSLTLTLMLIITGIGSLIHLYSVGYMEKDACFSRFFCYLNLFLFFMLLLVMGDSILTLFIGWEGVGLCSYLLIGFWHADPAKASAGKKAFVVNRIGDLGFLIGLFLLFKVLGDFTPAGESLFNYKTMAAVVAGHHAEILPYVTAITLCLFVGATGKSAQIPLFVWLPDAMAGPTPVSALIHAATMVTAGVYMIARLFFLFELSPTTLQVIATVGALTAFVAATIGLVQNDIKKVLAYSTVSQLGFMFLGVGVGAPTAAVFHLFTHAFFKACLFLGSGSVIHAMHEEQDIRHMGGLKKWMPATMATFVISTIAIAGIPPFSGFFSKDEILWQTWAHGHTTLYALGFLTAGLTAFYMFRLTALTFFGAPRMDAHHQKHLHESPKSMTVPLMVLAAFAALVGGLGIPESFGGHNFFHHFIGIEGVAASEASHDIWMEHFLATLSSAWAMLASLLALFIYLKRPSWPAAIAKRLRLLHQLLLKKYAVDEIYAATIVNPLHAFSQRVVWKIIDLKVIDTGLVGAGPFVVRGGARVLSALQSGNVASQIALFLIGTLLFIGAFWRG